jgi:hypothetical protein
MKIGYKATYDYICRDHKFEIGQSYELQGTPIPCVYGFHYCQNPIDVLHYYPIQHDFRLLEIEDIGESITQGNKSVTNKIRIIREVPKEEYYQLFGVVNNKLTISAGIFGAWERRTFDENNNEIFYQNSDGNWEKREYDERNNCIYYATLSGFWIKREYDERNNEVRFENSSGFWIKQTFDKNNRRINYESNYDKV